MPNKHLKTFPEDGDQISLVSGPPKNISTTAILGKRVHCADAFVKKIAEYLTASLVELPDEVSARLSNARELALRHKCC